MMEWWMLLVLVPAILVPVVILFGFAGCGAYLADPVIYAPEIQSAIPRHADAVELTWTHTNLIPMGFAVERRKGSEEPSEPVYLAASPFYDQSLEPGTQYTYRVKAISTEFAAESEWSDEVTIETWARAITSALETGGVNASVAGACIVQRLAAGTFSRPGNLVRITVRGADNGDLAISRVTISYPASQGNSFDSAAKPHGVAASLTAVAGIAILLPPVEFNVAGGDALLVAFDIGAPGNGRYVAGAPHTAYTKQAPPGTQVTEAATQNRAGFDETPNRVWFIDAVDVATKWPPVA